MLYNRETKKVKKEIDCISCRYYDSKLKKCEGLNKKCFEYDPLTKTAIDGVTKMPIKLV